MLKIDRTQKRFEKLALTSLSSAAISERYDLQEFIFNSPDVFFGELGEALFVVGKEVQPSEIVQDRIDLLAIDRDGNAVIVELKRGNDKLQLLQGISYAAMISKWRYQDFLERLGPARRDALEEFLEEVRIEDLNRKQRVILVAEAYDYEVLATAEWLGETYGVDLACCRISLAGDGASGGEYLSCTQILPAPELAEQAISRRQFAQRAERTGNWEDLYGTCINPEVVRFFRARISAGQPNEAAYRNMYYKIDGKTRWYVGIRKKVAYVWQSGQFEGDLSFWKASLSAPDTVQPVLQKQKTPCLRFHLITAADFEFFQRTMETTAQSFAWDTSAGLGDPEQEAAAAAVGG